MMRLAETNLTDTSMCHLGLSPDPFSNCKAMESEPITSLISWNSSPKLAVSKYHAFISVLASAVTSSTVSFHINIEVASNNNTDVILGGFALKLRSNNDTNKIRKCTVTELSAVGLIAFVVALLNCFHFSTLLSGPFLFSLLT